MVKDCAVFADFILLFQAVRVNRRGIRTPVHIIIIIIIIIIIGMLLSQLITDHSHMLVMYGVMV